MGTEEGTPSPALEEQQEEQQAEETSVSLLAQGLNSPEDVQIPGEHLPDNSICSTICPGCDEPNCKCPPDACWPGRSLDDTSDASCNCFAKLSFCAEGEEPQYTGLECPSCWPAENKACMCFAVLGFCAKEEGTPSPALEEQPEEQQA